MTSHSRVTSASGSAASRGGGHGMRRTGSVMDRLILRSRERQRRDPQRDHGPAEHQRGFAESPAPVVGQIAACRRRRSADPRSTSAAPVAPPAAAPAAAPANDEASDRAPRLTTSSRSSRRGPREEAQHERRAGQHRAVDAAGAAARGTPGPRAAAAAGRGAAQMRRRASSRSARSSLQRSNVVGVGRGRRARPRSQADARLGKLREELAAALRGRAAASSASWSAK